MRLNLSRNVFALLHQVQEKFVIWLHCSYLRWKIYTSIRHKHERNDTVEILEKLDVCKSLLVLLSFGQYHLERDLEKIREIGMVHWQSAFEQTKLTRNIYSDHQIRCTVSFSTSAKFQSALKRNLACENHVFASSRLLWAISSLELQNPPEAVCWCPTATTLSQRGTLK